MLISQPQCGMQLTASLVLVGWLDNAGSFDKLIPLLPPGEEGSACLGCGGIIIFTVSLSCDGHMHVIE